MADNTAENVRAFDLDLFREDTTTVFDGEESESEITTEDESESDVEMDDQDDCEMNGVENSVNESIVSTIQEWTESNFTRLGCTAHAL
jgi:hypothetical protein